MKQECQRISAVGVICGRRLESEYGTRRRTHIIPGEGFFGLSLVPWVSSFADMEAEGERKDDGEGEGDAAGEAEDAERVRELRGRGEGFIPSLLSEPVGERYRRHGGAQRVGGWGDVEGESYEVVISTSNYQLHTCALPVLESQSGQHSLSPIGYMDITR